MDGGGIRIKRPATEPFAVNETRFRELHAAGGTDYIIGKAMGFSRKTAWKYRRAFGLPTNESRYVAPRKVNVDVILKFGASKMTYTEIAEVAGCVEKSVARVLKASGFGRSWGGQPKAIDFDKLRALHASGASFQRMADELGVNSSSTIKRHCDRLGLKPNYGANGSGQAITKYSTKGRGRSKGKSTTVSHWSRPSPVDASTRKPKPEKARPITWEIPAEKPADAIEVHSCSTLVDWLRFRGAEIKQINSALWLVGRVKMEPNDLLARCNREAFLIGKPPFVWAAQ